MMMNIQNLQRGVPLGQYTTFKIGGPATYFVAVKTKEEMAHALNEARKNSIDWYILGGGSNLLVSDAGFDGLVIKSELRDVDIDEEKVQIRVGSGVLMSGVISKALQAGLSGLEFAIGVPATVGGAVWANLGARGKEIKDILIETSVIDAEGNLQTLKNGECQYGYRDSIFKHQRYIILDALFQMQKGDKEEMRKNIQQLSRLRNDSQDITAQCAGCIFRNPKDQTEESAGKLIDDLGLKGITIGGAQVSDIHANFIINTGDATAEDIIMLISLIKQKVRDSKGIQLMEEVEYLGF